MATTLKRVLEEDHILLNHNYRIEKSPADIGGYQLFCGQGAVFWDQKLDRVLSRYCMQVVDDCIFDTRGL